MLRRRFMMQKIDSGFVYNCKFKLYFGDDDVANKYKIGTSDYGIGFQIDANVSTRESTTSQPVGIYHDSVFADGKLLNEFVNRIEMKITTPDNNIWKCDLNEIMSYKNNLAEPTIETFGDNEFIRKYLTIGVFITHITGSGEDSDFAISLNSVVPYAYGIENKYRGSDYYISGLSSPTKKVGVNSAAGSSESISSVGNAKYISASKHLITNGIYTVDLKLVLPVALNKIRISNTGAMMWTVGKNQTYTEWANRCKYEWISDDGVMTDNMYKQDGTI